MGRSSNNFGALRLFFAVLVMLSHSFELVDGDRSREILTRIFGTLSFGELGVDGFFLISGYLITKSFQDSRSAGEYVFKRVLRIYPGYVVAYLLCLLALGPFVGGQLAALSIVKVLWRMVLLKAPEMEGVFAGTPAAVLDGAMWTIKYEFLCYLLVLAVGLIGLLSNRVLLSLLTIGLLALSALHPNTWGRFPGSLMIFLGEPDRIVHFIGVFGCGALFYLYRDRIQYDWRLAIFAAGGLMVLMFSQRLAEAALSILGGYLLFWFAFNVKSQTLAAVGQKVDVSYGVYLYAWPVQKLLIWLVAGISPWLLFSETIVIAGIIAFGSWVLVEKPLLNLKAAFVPVVKAEPGSATE
ncbi:MAG: acyltransferase [Methylocella sp.]